MVVLLVASGGGHLKELHTLLPRIAPDEDRLWLTFDNANSRSLLAGEQVQYVPYVAPRDVLHTAVNMRIAVSLCRKLRPSAAISTGSGVALAWLPVARAFGAKAHFIETATRTNGPSICGRLLLPVPGVHVYSQHRRWATGKVHYGGSVFDGYEATPRDPGSIKRVLVTVGSTESYTYDRLIQRLVAILPSDVEVIWQIGPSKVSGLAGEVFSSMPTTDLVAAHAWADVIVAHAGVGSASTALENGKMPVLVPRRKLHNEHIDDHQLQIAKELSDDGLAVSVEADDLTMDDLVRAASFSIERSAELPPFILAD